MGFMSGINKKNVIILLYQYSVVARGYEKALAAEGFNVTTVTDKFDQVDDYLEDNALIIVCLPNEITIESVRVNSLMRIMDVSRDHHRNMIFIGEKQFHPEAIKLLPRIMEYSWMDRPIEGPDLIKEVTTAVASAGTETSMKKKLLIVDDDPMFAKMVREWLKDTYQVDIVTAGMQAITFLLKNKVDLILLDYEMPVVDGPQVLQMLRQELATKDIPVMFLTGVGTKEAVSKVMALKPDGYVLKSTTKDNLLNSIKTIFIKLAAK